MATLTTNSIINAIQSIGSGGGGGSGGGLGFGSVVNGPSTAFLLPTGSGTDIVFGLENTAYNTLIGLQASSGLAIASVLAVYSNAGIGTSIAAGMRCVALPQVVNVTSYALTLSETAALDQALINTGLIGQGGVARGNQMLYQNLVVPDIIASVPQYSFQTLPLNVGASDLVSPVFGNDIDILANAPNNLHMYIQTDVSQNMYRFTARYSIVLSQPAINFAMYFGLYQLDVDQNFYGNQFNSTNQFIVSSGQSVYIGGRSYLSGVYSDIFNIQVLPTSNGVIAWNYYALKLKLYFTSSIFGPMIYPYSVKVDFDLEPVTPISKNF